MRSDENQLTRGKLLFINFHYVRDPDQYDHPGIHPIAPEEFRWQVEMLAARFHMATPQEAEAFVYGQAELPGPSVLLTFDDGLTDHAEAARDVLDPLGIKSICFVLSRPLMERRAVAIHKVHWLRATAEPIAFREAFLSHLPDPSKRLFDEGVEPSEAQAAYPYDSLADAKLKCLLNFHIALEVVDDICSRMLAERGIDEATFCGSIYMSDDNLRELHANGHMIAAHGHTHTAFARLDYQNMIEEITQSMDCIEAITASRPTWLSYPNGRASMIPHDATNACQELGIRLALTLKVGWNSGDESPFRLNRVNTNELNKVLAEVDGPAQVKSTA